MAANFEEKSGLVSCYTSWGSWGQTVEEVHVEVNVNPGTKAKDIKCQIQPKDVFLSVAGKTILKVCMLRVHVFAVTVIMVRLPVVGSFIRSCCCR